MIRFAKKAEPQPLPKDMEDKQPAQIPEPAVEGDKKSGVKTARARVPRAADAVHPT